LVRFLRNIGTGDVWFEFDGPWRGGETDANAVVVGGVSGAGTAGVSDSIIMEKEGREKGGKVVGHYGFFDVLLTKSESFPCNVPSSPSPFRPV
jgi:hypothetical protein